jgi:hypothetical protein
LSGTGATQPVGGLFEGVFEVGEAIDEEVHEPELLGGYAFGGDYNSGMTSI